MSKSYTIQEDTPHTTTGLTPAYRAGKYGFNDPNGHEAVPCRYDWVDRFYEGVAVIQLNGKYGFIDTTGHEVVPCRYNVVSRFQNNGLNEVKRDRMYGVINRAGEELIPCWYNNIERNPDDTYTACQYTSVSKLIYRFDHNGILLYMDTNPII
jgi:hypothetical protein